MDSTSTVSPRRIDVLLARYAESHRHPMNELIHCICVPAIVFSLLGLCWIVSPAVALLVAAAVLAWYLRLSPPFAVGMLAMSAVMLVVLARLPGRCPAGVGVGLRAGLDRPVHRPSHRGQEAILLRGPAVSAGGALVRAGFPVPALAYRLLKKSLRERLPTRSLFVLRCKECVLAGEMRDHVAFARTLESPPPGNGPVLSQV
jgi:hypothetical protein